MTIEEVIETLNKIVTCIEEDNKFCDLCEDCEKCECNVSESELEEFEEISRDYVHMFMEVIDELPSAQPKQQWIPCSERLPDKEGQYLVTDEAGGVVSIICDVFFHYDDGAPTWLLSQNVVAWMPLPEPYMESKK